MDIAALSMDLSMVKAQQQAAVSVMKLAMDSAKQQVGGFKELAEVSAKAVEQAAQPHLGRSIDVKV